MLKCRGGAKIGTVCTASMKVKQENATGDVIVDYCSTHSNHEKDIAHLRIPDCIRPLQSVAAKLQQGVTMTRILDDIRDSFSGEIGREHLLNTQDIRNVQHQYNILGIEKHANDHSSVTAWVSELRSSSDFDPVVYFKQQGEAHTDLDSEDFVLCIQMEFQQEIMKSFDNKVICMDATHGTNMYEFHLITVLVIDEFGEGVPVAWAISNKEDFGALSVVLQQLKLRTGDLKPQHFMSDDAQQYWNAWAAAYGSNTT